MELPIQTIINYLNFNPDNITEWQNQTYFLIISDNIYSESRNINNNDKIQLYQNLKDIIKHNYTINKYGLNEFDKHIYLINTDSKNEIKTYQIINNKICGFTKSFYIIEKLDIIQLIKLDKTGIFTGYYIFSSLHKIKDEYLTHYYRIIKDKFSKEFVQLIDLYLINENRFSCLY
jgi:hypothetical protein